MPVNPVETSQWRALIAKGRVEECLDEIAKWANQFESYIAHVNELQGRSINLKEKRNSGTQRVEDLIVEENKIIKALSELINDILRETLIHSPTKNLAPVSEDEPSFRETLINVLPPEISSLELLSEGDYNIVYKATRYAGTELEDEVAIKAFKNISLIQDENAKKIEFKFSLAQKYSNMDGIVTIFSNYMQVFPQYYIMRYVKGLDLDDYLAQDWPMSLHEIKHILRQVGQALKKGHHDDLLHLNLRPSNIKIDLDGDPQLLPFQMVQFNFSRRNIKRIKKLITYWSPEQINGEPLSSQTDQYALGLVAYELFNKKPLFLGDSVLEVIKRRFEVENALLLFYENGVPDILQKELEKTSCPAFFIDTIRQMLHPDPALRFLDMEELLDEIEEIEAPRTKINPDFRNLERSFSRCRKQDHFYTAFYQLFFEKRPQYILVFDRIFLAKEQQETSLNYTHDEDKIDEKKSKARWQFQHEMLDLAMDRMLLFHQERTTIKPRLENLAKSHHHLNIPPEDFAIFLDCMKETIFKMDEKTWGTPKALDQVWKSFSKPVLDIMLKTK
ncbi:MAG: protein kinase [Saprospiraceae bacterium]